MNKLIGYSLGFQGTEVYFPVKNPVEMFYEQLGGVQPNFSGQRLGRGVPWFLVKNPVEMFYDQLGGVQPNFSGQRLGRGVL